MAPQVIQIGSGKKQGGNGLFYAVGALGTAFAVDYWLSNRKMEEELERESAEIDSKKAEEALENIGEKEETEPLKTEDVEEISRFSNVDDFSEGELEKFIPANETSMTGLFKKFEPIAEEPELEEAEVEDLKTIIPEEKEVKTISEEEDAVVEIVAPLSPSQEPIKTFQTDFLELLPVALWKIILIAVLALLWMYQPTTKKVIPGLNEEFESDSQAETIPMLGSCESTEAAIAVAVDDLEKKQFGPKFPEQTNSLGELTFSYPEEGEEKWGIVAILMLAMMIL